MKTFTQYRESKELKEIDSKVMEAIMELKVSEVFEVQAPKTLSETTEFRVGAEFMKEYGDKKLSELDEGLFGRILGGIAGFVVGPMVGKVIANALGIEKGIIYDMLTSRLANAALGAALGKYVGGRK